MDQRAKQAAQDLDYARCRGNWSAVADLARRYQQTHPEESVLEATALVEVDFNLELQRTRGLEDLDLRRRSASAVVIDELYQDDNPQKISLPQPLPAAQCQSFINRLQEIIEPHRSSTMNTVDSRQAQFARIILARVYFEIGEHQKALDELKDLALRVEDVSSGYGLVLLIQARAVKGISFEMLGDIPGALQAYTAAWDAVEQHLSEKGELLSFWIEECLYRGILLCLRTSAPRTQTLRLMRGYMQLAATNWTVAWHTSKQWIIYRAHIQYLAKDYAQLTNNSKSKISPPIEELNVLMSSLRKVLAELSTRLEPKAISQRLVDLVDIIIPAHDAIGWGDVNNIRAIAETIHRAQKSTFNNPRIMRYTLQVLLRLGSFDEARYAFRSYVTLIGLPDIDILIEDKQKVEMKDAVERASIIRQKVEHSTDSAFTGESWQDIVSVLLTGVELYGREFSNGKVAAGIADLAVALSTDKLPIYHKCHRARGVAYGVLASQCDNPDIRSEYHNQAIASLQQAVALDDLSWESHYELAVQQAVIRDTKNAINSVTRSLQLKQNHLPSWHLLALLHSCKRNNQMPQALQTLETGLKDSRILASIPNGIHTILPVLSSPGQENSHHYFDEAESHLAMRMSQIQILEALEGSDAVLSLYADLFAVYGKISQLLGLDTEEEVLVETPLTDLDPSSPQESSFSSLSTNGASRAAARSRSRTGSASVPAVGRQRSLSANGNGQSNTNGARRPSELQHQASDLPPLSPSANASRARHPKQSTSEETRNDRKASPLNGDDGYFAAKPHRDRSKTLRQKSLQLLDMGLARRIGTSNSNASIPNGRPIAERHGSTESSTFSLASLLTPSFSGRSNSMSKTSTAFISTVPIFKESTFLQSQRERWHHQLIKLWLMSTNTFIHAGRFDEATKAVMEAEQQLLVGHLNDASVWYQLGLVCIKKANGNKNLFETGLDAFKKALSIDPDHVETLVEMAECLINLEEWEVAEGLLDRATQGQGWDNARAWYLLGNCYRHHHERFDRAKDCYLYALELDETQPLQPYTTLPRFVF